MQFSRNDLASALKVVSPAIAPRHIISAYEAVAFDEGFVYACDEIVAIAAPFDAGDFQGCLPGQLLTKWVGASRTKAVDVVGDTATKTSLKSGRAKIDLAKTKLDAHPFKFPDDQADFPMSCKTPSTFVAALDSCARVMDADPTAPWRMGVTLVFKGKQVTMWAGSETVIARSQVDKVSRGKGPSSQEFGLSPRFVQVVVARCKDDQLVELWLSEEATVAVFKSGVRVWASANSVVDVSIYDQAIGAILEPFDNEERTISSLPVGFAAAMDRLLITADHHQGQDRATIKGTIMDRKGKSMLRLQLKSESFNVVETLAFDHEPCEFEFVASDVRALAPVSSRLAIDSDRACMVFETEEEQPSTNFFLSLVS